jgi:hypothetical protein
VELLGFLVIDVLLPIPAPLLLKYLADNLFDLLVMQALSHDLMLGLTRSLLVLYLTDEVPLLEAVDLRHPILIILEFLEQFLTTYDLDMDNTF